MKKASLQIFEPNAEPLTLDISERAQISIGRTPENDIALTTDSNVSRRHALILKREDNFYLLDNTSVNGTFINNEKLSAEKLLADGDLINIGGASVIAFSLQEIEAEKLPKSALVVSEILPVTKKSFSTATAAIFGGLALISVFGAGAYLLRAEKCEPTANIVSPLPNSEITDLTDIKLRVQQKQCVAQIIFKIDDKIVQTVDDEPFTAHIEAADYDDGKTHVISVELKNKDDEIFPLKETTFTAVEQELSTEETAENDSEEVSPVSSPTPVKSPKETANVSISEVKKMSEDVLRQFSNGTSYRLDAPLLSKIQAQTAEYKADGFFKRATVYRDVINIAFAGEQGLDAPLAYLLAMSRTKYVLPKSGTPNGEGLWAIKQDFVVNQGYAGVCGTETLSENNQNCAARATALYLKQLVFDRFNGDFLYAVACFGMAQNEAQSLAQTLPNERANIWQNLKIPAQRDNVSRFLAAAIVAENPSKFGLKRDQNISSLYRNLLNK